MATEAAAARAAELGLPKLNSYPHSRGGRGGSRQDGRGGHRGSFGRGQAGAEGAQAGKPQRRRTLERKLKRAKGTNRMMDSATGTVMGRAAALTNAKTKLQRRLAAEGGAAVGEVDTSAPLLPVKKKQKVAAAQPAVKKAQLLPAAAGSGPASTLPDFLRALGVAPGARDANGEAAWDLDEEMRYYEQQLGVRKLKKKKAAQAAAAKAASSAAAAAAAASSSSSATGTVTGDGNDSDDAELDTGAMSKLRKELEEDGLGDLFDFCDLLESGGTEGKYGSDGEQDQEDDDDGFPDVIHDDSSSKKKKAKSKAEAASASSASAAYSSERAKLILEREAAIDAKQEEIESALKEAMDKQKRKVERANAKQKRMDEAAAEADPKSSSRKRARDGDAAEEDEEDEDEAEEEEDEEEEEEDVEGSEDEEDEELEDGEDDDDHSEQEEEEEDVDMDGGDDDDAADGEAGEDADAAAAAAAAAEEKKKPMTVAEMYGFDRPLPESLLAFRRGDSNILSKDAGAAATADGSNGAAGSAAAPAAPAKYIPPHLRAQMAAAAASVGSAAAPPLSAAAAAAAAVGPASASTAAGQATLRRQLKGLLNRLTAANLEHIALQMTSTLFSRHSKRELTSLLCDELLALCTREADSTTGGYSVGSTSETLLAAAALVVFLHATVGQDLGAHFLEKFTLQFTKHALEAKQLQQLATTNAAAASRAAASLRSCTTLVTFLTYLYQLELIGSNFIYELVRYFLEDFSASSIELLLIILQNGGQQMRKDDPAALKEIILLTQQKAKTVQNDKAKPSATATAAALAQQKGFAAAASSPEAASAHLPEGRVSFMLETIYDLKNNKKRSGGSSESELVVAPLRAWLHSKLKRRKDASSSAEAQLRIGFQDILNIQSKGRWWLVGSAWKGKRQGEEEGAAGAASSASSTAAAAASGAAFKAAAVSLPQEDASDRIDLLSLARSHHMTTSVRKSLFLVLMSASDYLEAYERLTKLALPPSQLRQVVKVIFECAGHESKANPYYSHVLLQLMRMDGSGKEIRFTTQLALWDAVTAWGDQEQKDALRKALTADKNRPPEQAKQAFHLGQQRQVLNLAKLVALLLREPTTGGGAGAGPTGGSAHRSSAAMALSLGGDPTLNGGGGGAGGLSGGGLGLQVLKCFDFHALSSLQLLFLTATLKDFLLHAERKHLNASMLRLHAAVEEKRKPSSSSAAPPPPANAAQRQAEMRLLRDGLDFFLRHHLAPTANALTNKEQGALLKKRIASARAALQGNVDEDWMFNK